MPYVQQGNTTLWQGDTGPTADEIRAQLASRGMSTDDAIWGQSGHDTASIQDGDNGQGYTGPHIVTQSGGGGGGGAVAPSMAALGVGGGGAAGGAAGGGGQIATDVPSLSDASAGMVGSSNDPEPATAFQGGPGSLRQGIGIRQPPSMAALFTGMRPY